MKEVEIVFSSEQDHGDSLDKSRLTAKGTLEKRDGKLILTYREPDSEMGGAVSVIEILSPEFVILKRTGSYETVFKIEKGKHHTCLYKTPFGEMEMEIFAENVSAEITERGGKISLFYSLTSNSRPLGENSLVLEVK